ncbi:MAG: acyl-CoA thioesterase [Clostridiales Family XIII bacterium]|jgi:uncharacterized protein (TIGR00369 family)|nr:acyl-CoA thioesterase [Clostridiales Family XIII bacterium]
MNENTELVLSVLMQPSQTNSFGNIHGGEIMKLMDNAAGALAIRFAKSTVVTARVDQLEFLRPVHVGNLVTCKGKVAYVGNTSIEVFLTVDVEDIKMGYKERALEAFFTLVAIDGEGKPHRIAQAYTPETDEERRIYKIAKERRDEQRLQKSANL